MIKFLEKIDYKIMAITILTSLLMILFFKDNGPKIDYHKDEIKALHKQNDSAFKVIKNLNESIKKHDKAFATLQKKYNINEKKIAELNLTIERLNQKKDAIPKYVDSLDAASVKSEFDKYLKRRNTNKHN